MFKNNASMRHILLGDETINNRTSFQDSRTVNHIYELSTDLDFWHNSLGGSSGTFAIATLLLKNENDWSEADSICINQYRKFISNMPLGAPSDNYPGMYMLPEATARDIDVYDLQQGISTPFLIANPINVGNTYLQYCESHQGQDLLRYIAIAIDRGHIDKTEASAFMNSSLLIPGGIEFGLYPIAVFLDIATKLQGICLEFLKASIPTNRNRYQRRALSFCNERLGSYLLMKVFSQLGADNIPKEWFGHIETVSNETRYFGST